MKIKNKVQLDFLKRKKFFKFENEINLKKVIAINKILNNTIKNEQGNFLFNSIQYQNKYRNICQLSGRTRGNINLFKINRTQFKLHINEKKINGVKNASW